MTTPTTIRIDDARRLHALVDGLALHLSMLSADSTGDASWALAVLRRELTDVVASWAQEHKWT